MLEAVLAYWWVVPIVALLVGFKLVMRIFGVVLIPEDSLGVVNKKFALLGKNTRLPDGAIIALQGEAGLQADTLAPGVHFWLWPWQYEVQRQKFINISEGRVGVVESRDGKSLSKGRVLARMVACDSYQNARGFLETGGERGPQIAIIPPGTYRINTALFTVVEEDALEIADNMVGVVTTKDGRPLDTGEIAGPEIANHNMFQDGESFLHNGGFRGLQEQVILAGRYYINPRFATVEEKPMTEVPIAHAGVVISYVGKPGKDVTGAGFKHGNLVSRGEKGVWVEPYDPGKYPINPYTHKVENVPTQNVVLNWATGKTESHRLDEKLSTITVRSSDGFPFNLDVSQIIHIPRNDAPKVIARFGSVANLVTQVLEPTIGNYFRNAAQGSDAIAFLKQRQTEAREKISGALREYDVGAVDTLIGDIVPPDALMKTLTDRKIADEQRETFKTQQIAEEARKQFEQAKAQAATQAKVVDAERQVQIAKFDAESAIAKADGEAQSAIKKATGDAESKTINARADASVLDLVGVAKGKNIKAIGEAEAEVIKLKTTAIGQGNYAMIESVRALAEGKNALVPQIVASGGGASKDGGGGGGTLLDVIIANLLKAQMRTP